MRPHPAVFIAVFLLASTARSEGPTLTQLRGLAAGAADLPAVRAAVAVPQRAPGLPADEARIAAVCRSADPVLVLDNFLEAPFVPAYVDVDGDGKPDVAHGDLVAAIYRASGKAVSPVNLYGDGGIPNLAEILGPVADKVERGELKISAVSLSQTADAPIAAIGRDLGVSAAPEDLLARREEINEALIKMLNAHDDPEYGQLTAIAARLAARGVPILLAAGNEGPSKLNLIGLLPGAISIGSLRRDGSKSVSSADNSLVTAWRVGEVVLRRTQDGNVDVNGDGVGRFDKAKLSGGKTVASRFDGRPLSEVVQKTPTGGNFDILSRETPGGIARLIEEMPDALYRTEDLIKFFKREGQPYAEVMRATAPFYDKSMTYPFKDDGEGHALFDPAGDGSPGQAAYHTGTSFAVPALCAAP